MIVVKATREMLVGHETASGYVIDTIVPFIALPSRKALYRFVRLRNPANNKTALAISLDVGPWCIDDDAYVFGGSRPQSESGIDQFGRKTNGAGIDLGEKIWHQLEMTDNNPVEWEFID